MIWKKNEIDAGEVREMANRFDLDLLSSAILVRRDITKAEDICFFLEDDLRYLHNPFLFDDMRLAVDRVQQAIEEGEKVLVFGDRDVDGITSLVIMYQALKKLGCDVTWDLPRGNDTYGLSKKVIDEAAENDITLLITVDCGTSNLEEIQHACDKGIDTIVTDHHLTREELPPAYAFINPKLPDSGYPFRDLAGCGVVYKFCKALEFSTTEMYNQEICLLNVRPANDTFVIEAAKIVNLVETARITEIIVPDVIQSLDGTRLVHFLQGQQIFVYDKEPQIRMLRQIWGNNVDINLIDLAPQIWEVFPPLQNKSLFRMKEMSKMARYQDERLEELSVFVNLFVSFIQARQKETAWTLEGLDLVALGTLADMMPLLDENRILVKKGLSMVNTTLRPGLDDLLIKQNMFGKQLSTTDISWQITPVINSSGRMGEPNKAVELFICEDDKKRSDLADYIINMNKDRKLLGDESWEKVFPKGYEALERFDNKLVIITDDSLTRGITGIIASRLVKSFKVPAIAIAMVDDLAIGSLRTSGNFKTTRFLEECSEFFDDYGGHDCAAGFNMKRDRLEPFLAQAQKIIKNFDPNAVNKEETITVDAELPLKYLNEDLAKIVDLFEPYGEGNRPIKFMTKGLKVLQLDLVGKQEKNHVKMLLDAGVHKWPALFWNGAERVDRNMLNTKIDIVFQVSRNQYQGNTTLQLTLADLKPSTS